jgi:MFS family permease
VLGRVLERAGYERLAVVRDPARPTRTADRLFGSPTPISPARDLDGVAALPVGTVAVIDTGGDVAALAAAVAEIARPTDLVIVAGVVPEPLRVRHGVRLGVVAFQGPGFSRGLLSSPTTRRRGLIAITDITPTIADVLGVPIDEVEGRAAVEHASPDPIVAVRELERRLLAGHSARGPVTRTPLYAGMLLAIGVFLVTRKTGLAPGARTALRFLGSATLALPISGFLAGSIGRSVVPAMLLLTVAIATVGLRAPRATAIGIAAATAIIPTVDLILGSPIGHRSSWGVLLSTGGRFYGASEDTLGFIAAGALVTAGLLVRTHAHVRIAVVAFAALTAIAAAPGLGAKFGAAPTLVPAFAVFAVVALGRPVTLKIGLVIALATVFVTGGVILADKVRPEATRSHVARAIGGEADVGALIARKWEANAAITFRRMWSPAALLSGAGLLLLARRRRLDAGLRRAGPALAVVTGTALVANDGGVVTVAIILVIALAAATVLVTQESDA